MESALPNPSRTIARTWARSLRSNRGSRPSAVKTASVNESISGGGEFLNRKTALGRRQNPKSTHSFVNRFSISEAVNVITQFCLFPWQDRTRGSDQVRHFRPLRPLYFFFQLQNVASLVPSLRQTSATVTPLSACCNANTQVSQSC